MKLGMPSRDGVNEMTPAIKSTLNLNQSKILFKMTHIPHGRVKLQCSVEISSTKCLELEFELEFE